MNKIEYLIDWDKKIKEFVKQHLRFEDSCQRCGYCCQNNRILVTIPEMIDILRYLGVHFDRVFLLEPNYYTVSIKTKQINNTSYCIFYDNGKCTIYDVRPFQCMVYPAIFYPKYKDFAVYHNTFFGHVYFKCQGRMKSKLKAKIEWMTLELLTYERIQFLMHNYKLQKKLIRNNTIKNVVELYAWQ